MILVFLIIVLDGLSVMKLVWRKNNTSKNFRGGKMLNVNSVVVSVKNQSTTLCKLEF